LQELSSCSHFFLFVTFFSFFLKTALCEDRISYKLLTIAEGKQCKTQTNVNAIKKRR
jgi:hypothetical protein